MYGLALLHVLAVCNHSATAADDQEAVLMNRGRAALRDMDCARCHGRDYRGWAAPSLIDAVRDGSRERFERYVLDGDIVRGMPGYRSQPRLVTDLDAIYLYLRMRGRQEPASPPGPATPREAGR
ncbi:MAG: c-type cytochrome [Burkholderiaceae bacterium]|nr:c-type cytochrome [Burkholderiaceae bacterium]